MITYDTFRGLRGENEKFGEIIRKWYNPQYLREKFNQTHRQKEYTISQNKTVFTKNGKF